MNYPEDLKYSPEHTWIRLDQDVGTIGITDFAQEELGDIVYVELPAIGQPVQARQKFGEIESVKTVSELIAPVSGKWWRSILPSKTAPSWSTRTRLGRAG